ncbi:MAG TPA: hypothetical protein VNN22_23610 [Verrucomicrobiae bacterium]|nr:hypothetical protein [Verrucomicrobiae bacterium]
MRATNSAPLLTQVKSWQLLGLGFAGWITLYSIALINWASCGKLAVNAQGGFFATTMALAGLETRRLKKNRVESADDSPHWADNIPTVQLNQTLDRIQQKYGFKSEPLHDQEIEMGFGVRTVKEGRTFVFETSRWKEPTIDLFHAQTTNENRKMAKADLAVIVSTGVPDESTKLFVKSAPLQLLYGEELQELIETELPKPEENATPGEEKPVEEQSEQSVS